LCSQPAVSLCLCRGRFGQVHRCTENSTGLPLAAKIIKVKSAKDRVRYLPGVSQVFLAKLRAPPLPTQPPTPAHIAQAPPSQTGDSLPFCLCSMTPTFHSANQIVFLSLNPHKYVWVSWPGYVCGTLDNKSLSWASDFYL
jgi:hypothetical protein